MATSFDSLGSCSHPMAWPPQPAGVEWPRQQAPVTFESDTAGTSTHLLAQLGLVPSQAMPARGTHNGSMPMQTLLSTTVAPQRSNPQHRGEQVTVGCMESSAQSQSPFLLTPPSHSQRYQGFSPGSDVQAAEDWMSTAQGSAVKQFRFNPHAIPFVFSSASIGMDRYSDLAAESTCANLSNAHLSSEDGEELSAGEAAAVPAAVASAAIFSPQQGSSRASALLVSPASTDPARGSWRRAAAGVADSQAWLPARAAAPGLSLPSPQEIADDYSKLSHDSHVDVSAESHADSMCPTLMQLRGTAHSVALGALSFDSPEMGPSFSPRATGLLGISV